MDSLPAEPQGKPEASLTQAETKEQHRPWLANGTVERRCSTSMAKQEQPSDEGQPRGWGGQSWGAGPGLAVTVAGEKGEGRHTAAHTFQTERPGDHKSILFLKKKTEQIYTKYFHLFWATEQPPQRFFFLSFPLPSGARSWQTQRAHAWGACAATARGSRSSWASGRCPSAPGNLSLKTAHPAGGREGSFLFSCVFSARILG